MKKKLLFLFAMTLFLTGNLFAQVIQSSTYAFNRATAGPSAYIWTELIPSGSDNVASAVTNIGFDFWFAGTKYTQFSVSENGLLKLGSTPISGTDITNNMASGTTAPKIAPYWDDLATGTTGSVGYYLYGTAPDRILFVNWFVTVPKNTVGAANTTLQVKLYETNNRVILNHGAILANSGAATIGIGKSSTDYASISASGGSASCVYYPSASYNSNIYGINQCSYNFTPDYTAPPFSNVTLTSTGTATSTVTAKIADYQTGVSLSGSLVPRIYYKKGAGGSYFSTPGVYTSGTATNAVFTFTINHSDLGGVSGGDQIYYYLIAQDQSASGLPNIASNPSGVVATDVNTITTPPTSPLSYIIPISFSGTVNVGSGETFESLTNAGGLFDQINNGELTSNLTVNITSDLTAETGWIGLNAWVNNGGTYTVTINPVGNRIVSGITVNGGNGSVISINGATGLTIDGLNDGSNSLTFNQTGLYYFGSVIDLKGASGNTITNVSINNWNNNNAISITNSTLPSSNNTISNCIISSNGIDNNRGQGIKLTGSSSLGSNNVIKNNTVTNFTYQHIWLDGKFTNTEISGNDIYNTLGTNWALSSYAAINISTASGGGTTAVFSNKIHDILTQNNSTAAVPAIYAYGQSGTTTNIYNNEISLDVASNPLVGRTGISTYGYGNVNIYYNSIYIGGTDISAGDSYGIYKLGYGPVDIKNNVIYNARSNGTTGSTGKHYGIFVNTLYTNPPTSDYNDIFVNGVGGVVGFSTSDRLTLGDWQSASGQDANSISADPLFTSTSNLLPLASSPLVGGALSIEAITDDITGLARDLSIPTIGAYEVAPPPCENPTIAGEIATSQSGCGSLDPALITSTSAASGETGGALEYIWQMSTSSNASGFAPIASSNSETYDPGVLTQTTWYKRLARVDCKNDWIGAVESNVVEMTVNTVPEVITSNMATICDGSSPVISLTATVASNYTWTVGTITNGITGANPGSGNLIDEVLTNAGTIAGTVEYIVTPTSVTGTCEGPAYPITVTVNPTIHVSVIITGQNQVCAGTEVLFASSPVNCGNSPTYAWKVENTSGTTTMGTSQNFLYTPSDGDIITCEVTPDPAVVCPSASVAVSSPINMVVNTNVTPTISIGTTATSICEDGSLTFTANVTFEGDAPHYQWKVNDNNAGSDSPSFDYIPADYAPQTNNAITCVLTSNSPCATTTQVTSNSVNITVNPILTASVTIAADANPVVQEHRLLLLLHQHMVEPHQHTNGMLHLLVVQQVWDQVVHLTIHRQMVTLYMQ